MESADGMAFGFHSDLLVHQKPLFAPPPPHSFSHRIGIIRGLATLVVLDGCQQQLGPCVSSFVCSGVAWPESTGPVFHEAAFQHPHQALGPEALKWLTLPISEPVITRCESKHEGDLLPWGTGSVREQNGLDT